MSTVLRGRILHCLDKPDENKGHVEYFEDGVLVIENDKIAALLHAEQAQSQGLDLAQVPHMGQKLIVPGFLDTHVHAPQIEVMASYGKQLLDWLENFTFPAEMRFADQSYAKQAMGEFLDQLIASGTTTAMVFSTSHESATELLFQAASERNMRLIAGKVLMDRNAPTELCDTPEKGYQSSISLIDHWHNEGRLAYAVTPRFSITSSDEQLKKAGELMSFRPGLYMQTHLSENLAEIEMVKRLFPWARSYLDTYDKFGLCSERSIFAHCVHLQDDELDRLQETGGKIAFCPSSNMFLGSGLFDWQKIDSKGVDISLASDVGGGLSLSMLSTLGEAYRVCQLKSMSLDPMLAFYSITLGNARALDIDHLVGNLKPGTEADFLVLDPHRINQVGKKYENNQPIEQEWFTYMMYGDERLVDQTWIAGQLSNPAIGQVSQKAVPAIN